MSVERFSAWYFAQPELIQLLILWGPPFLVSVVIGRTLGGRLRLMVFAWLFNPTVAGPLEAERSSGEDDAGRDWALDAKISVDELVARRQRGLK